MVDYFQFFPKFSNRILGDASKKDYEKPEFRRALVGWIEN